MLCVFVQFKRIVSTYPDTISATFDVVGEFYCSIMIYLAKQTTS
jgi:hypothetical protein